MYPKDLTGQVFGKLTVIKKVSRPSDKKSAGTYWECQCLCGNTKIFSRHSLIQKEVQTCGCFSRIKDLSNQKFGKLIALYPIESNTAHKQWHCKCDCGNECNVESSRLIAGITQSCGCLKLEVATKTILQYAGKNKKDILNQRFGKLLVLEETSIKNNKSLVYKCICDCGNIHFVSSHHLLNGQIQSCGCNISRGEDKIFQILKEQNIIFETQKTFSNLISDKKGKLRFDFYLPEQNICLEYQGIQHYNSTSRYYSKEGQKRDDLKREYCQNNNIKLIEIPYTDYNKITWEYLKEKLYG